MSDKLTRRGFLQRGFLAGLAACAGPQRTAEITPVTPMNTSLPTSPTAESTPIPGSTRRGSTANWTATRCSARCASAGAPPPQEGGASAATRSTSAGDALPTL
jgi:hypothetical protein